MPKPSEASGAPHPILHDKAQRLKAMKHPVVVYVLVLSILIFSPGQVRGYSTHDRTLIPTRSEKLVPFTPLQGSMTLYMPDRWTREAAREGRWSFTIPSTGGGGPCLIKGDLGSGVGAQTFEEFLLEFSGPDSQTRVNGPLPVPPGGGFLEKSDDRRERYFVHFIKDGQMLSAIFGAIDDEAHGRRISLSLVFCADDLDYYDALSCAILCNARLPGAAEEPLEIWTYGRYITIYPCTALNVPPGQATPEEAISSYYSCLITNRWEKARKYLLPSIDLYPPPATPLFKDRVWWTLHWFRLLYLAQYKDRMECSVMKEVLQRDEATLGVDSVMIKMRGRQWYIAQIP